MSTLDLATGVESGELDLNDTASMDYVPLWRVCMRNNYYTSKCSQIQDRMKFVRIRNNNFIYWQKERDGYNNNSSAERNKYC